MLLLLLLLLLTTVMTAGKTAVTPHAFDSHVRDCPASMAAWRIPRAAVGCTGEAVNRAYVSNAAPPIHQH